MSPAPPSAATTHLHRVLRIVCAALVGVGLLSTVLGLVLGGDIAIVAGLGAFAMGALCLVLLRGGRTELVGWIGGGGLLSVALYSETVGLGVHDVGAQIIPTAILLAGLTMARRSFLVFVAIAVSGSVVISGLHAAGGLPAALAVSGGPVDYLLHPLLVLTTAWLLTSLTQGFQATASELRSERRRLRDIIRSSRDGILLLDEQRRVVLANPALGEFVGRAPETLVGEPVSALGEDQRTAAETSASGVARFDWRIAPDDQDERIAEVVTRDIPTPSGGYAALWSVRDVTEQRAMLERGHRLDKLRAVGQLAAGVAHDFNNQAAGMILSAESILGLEPEDGRIREAAQAIIESGMRASERSSALLRAGSPSSGDSRPVDLNALVEEVARLLRHRVDARIEVEVDAGADSAWVEGDPGQLQNALLNLAINSRDAMPEGGRLCLSTAATAGPEGEGGVQVEVRDTGQGIDPETLAHVMEPFYTSKAHGTGLGLFTVHRCVEALGGHTEIESSVGVGTAVRLWLPLCEAPPERAAPSATSEPLPRGLRVLFAEDEAIIARIARAYLGANMGFEVEHCADGDLAAECFLAAPDSFDLALLDIQMPGRTGLEVLALMQQVRPELPVVVASANATPEIEAEVLAGGGRALIRKPFRLDDLKAQLRDALQQPVA